MKVLITYAVHLRFQYEYVFFKKNNNKSKQYSNMVDKLSKSKYFQLTEVNEKLEL